MIAAPPPTPVRGVRTIDEHEEWRGPLEAPASVAPLFDPAPRARRRVVSARSLLGTLGLAIVALGGAVTVWSRIAAPPAALAPIALAPATVLATLKLDGALVRAPLRSWTASKDRPPRYGDPVPVQLTAYCLKGTTRRDNYVRQGIVAADPRLFPLGRYVDLYVGRRYFGRFLVDDTGAKIKNAILDIWTPACRDARLFGRQRGTAVLVPRPRGAHPDTLLTGRLGGAATPPVPATVAPAVKP